MPGWISNNNIINNDDILLLLFYKKDQVRLLCMESLKNMAKILNTNENKTNILPLII